MFLIHSAPAVAPTVNATVGRAAAATVNANVPVSPIKGQQASISPMKDLRGREDRKSDLVSPTMTSRGPAATRLGGYRELDGRPKEGARYYTFMASSVSC